MFSSQNFVTKSRAAVRLAALINAFVRSRPYPIWRINTIALIIALPFLSNGRQTAGGAQPFPTKYISSLAGGEVAQVTGGCDEGGKAPSCTPRGARRAEFNLEQPYVLWCSVHGQCSRHRTNARQRSALSRREPRWLRPSTFSLLS